MNYEKLIRERFSVRDYSSKKVEDEKLYKIYQAGQVAPTAKNYQPQIIYVLKSDEAINKIRNITKCAYNAPVVFLVCYDKYKSFKNTKSFEDSGVEDASICTTQMMLEATNIGLGTCWVNLYDSNDLKKEFDLKDNIVPVCLLLLGYTGDNVIVSPFHNTKKNIDELFIEV